MKTYNLHGDIHDPRADPDEAREEYDLQLTVKPKTYDGLVLCVAHNAVNIFRNPSISHWGEK